MAHFLTTLKKAHLSNRGGGLTAVCSAHPEVIRAAAVLAAEQGRALLLEATASQVNQDGGYTGMTPEGYAAFVRAVAEGAGLPAHRVVLGADHLGPAAWPDRPADAGMQKAENLVRRCVAAGFAKIHLDTGRSGAGDQSTGVSGRTTARRAAMLCRAAEESAAAAGGRPPLYVIGDDVPPPGGGLGANGRPAASSPASVSETIRRHREAFDAAGLGGAWDRVIAVVVQPGVEFGDRSAAAYRREAAASLAGLHAALPGQMTFEVHSADYQKPAALRQMVRDHFLLIKIGPWLTLAYREALYALESVELQMPGIAFRSDLRKVMESLMVQHPENWRSLYEGDEETLRFLRHFSLRDRIRYYWTMAPAVDAVNRLLENLRRPVPAALLRQYFPDFDWPIEEQPVPLAPERIVSSRIRKALLAVFESVSGPAPPERLRAPPPL